MPKNLQEKIFEKLFTEAEIAKLNSKDMQAYEESLKVYWDNYSVLATAKKEGKEDGINEEKASIAKRFKEKGIDVQIIVETTGLTQKQIDKL